MNLAEHWEGVYVGKPSIGVSWYREHLEVSLQLLERAGLDASSRLIDVGGGASTLVDDVLARGVESVCVLDLSASALAAARSRLGARASDVGWIVGDIGRIPVACGAYTHWHDRAAMHFMESPEELRRYAAQAERAVVAGGHAVIGGFAPDGPERCSGLPVARRSAAEIAAVLGPSFVLLEERHEIHRTPGGSEQAFVYALLRREV